MILDTKWWSVFRYDHFGRELASKLNGNKKLKNELRQLFKAQQDKLSYCDLFYFIEKKLGISL